MIRPLKKIHFVIWLILLVLLLVALPYMYNSALQLQQIH
ncbi:MAG: hypothetical protein RL516_990 [Bacteroidota bacterium]|jgi:hypothetical protein